MRVSRWLLALLVSAGIGVALAYDAVGFVGEAYPSDRIKRAALDKCSASERHFLRFLSQDRHACYAAQHLPGYDSGLNR